MTHEEKDKLLEQKDAELEALRQKAAELEAKAAAAQEETAAANAAAAAAQEETAAANAAAAAAKAALETANVAKPEETENQKPATVRLELYKDENIKDDVQVFVNGRQYIIQRGVPVDVPYEVFVVLRNQQRMKKHIIAYNEKHESK